MASKNQYVYYITMTFYLGINAFMYFIMNQTVTGTLSDVYLGGSMICGIVAAMSAVYMVMEDGGDDSSEADITICNVTLNKSFFYLASLVAIAARIYFAYQSNHNATGAESVWGYVWFVVSALLIVLTYGNAKIYFKKKIRIASDIKRQAAVRAAVQAQAKKE